MSAFDAIVVGETMVFGSYEFTAERIKRFARDWDPQPFHMDEAAAASGPYGGLIASGWHTAAVMMRLQVDYFARNPTAHPRFRVSPGFDDLKWLKPVHAGDTITYSGRVTNKRLSRSRLGTGVVTTQFSGVNQKGDDVFAVTAHVIVAVD
jgi:acyl dehydratase